MRKVLAGAVFALLLAAGVSLLPIWPERGEPRAGTPPSGQAQRVEAKPVEPVLTGSTKDDEAVSLPAVRESTVLVKPFFATAADGHETYRKVGPPADEILEAVRAATAT